MKFGPILPLGCYMTHIKPFTLWILILFVGCLYIYQFLPEYFTLVPFMFYMILSTSFITLPHEPLLLTYGKMYGVLMPSLLALIPTIIGSYLDYLILSPLLSSALMQKVKT
jgi:uncharacterized membrane protein YdjX (TVP38/TMEM64 family)